MKIIEELKLVERELIERKNKTHEDASDMLENMGYAEKIVLNKEFLSKLAELKPVKRCHKIRQSNTVSLRKKDIIKYRKYEIGIMNGIAFKINQVFSALEIPYKARGHTYGTILKSGKKKENNEIQIYRYGKEFKYLKTYVPTTGMYARVARWVEEYGDGDGDEVFDILKKIGMDVIRI